CRRELSPPGHRCAPARRRGGLGARPRLCRDRVGHLDRRRSFAAVARSAGLPGGRSLRTLPQAAIIASCATHDGSSSRRWALPRAAKGKRPALVLGVQGANTDAALEYARAAEQLEPDALIAMPPSEAQSLDDYRRYFRALAGVTKRPFFVQTTGGSKKVAPE